MVAASLSQQIGESINLLSEEDLSAIASGDKDAIQDVLANLPDRATDAAQKQIVEALKNMGMIGQGQTIQANDFILRPGEAPIRFNEDDIILGGTQLLGDTVTDMSNKINTTNTNLTTTNVGGGQTGPIELTGTLTVKGEGENATVNVRRLLAQMNSGDLQSLSMMLANATA